MSLVKKLKSNRGFTLVELMIVVVIIGILAALAIYGVRQYVTNAKTGEARLALGRMSKDAVSAFEGERMAGQVLQLGGQVGTSRRMCLTAENSVPPAIMPDGTKYQPQPTDWRPPAEPANGYDATGWTCLKYTMEQPIYFMYDYQSSQAPNANPQANDGFTVSGQAEMGGIFKVLSLSGLILMDNNTPTLVVSPAILEEEANAVQQGLQRWAAATP